MIDILPKNCMRHDALAGTLSWWSCQSQSARSCGLLNHLNSFCRVMFKFNAKFDAGLLLYSVILNTMATEYKCSLNGISCLCWLGQWSHHCSYMCIPVHSPGCQVILSVTQTILVILTMAGLFLDWPCTSGRNESTVPKRYRNNRRWQISGEDCCIHKQWNTIQP